MGLATALGMFARVSQAQHGALDAGFETDLRAGLDASTIWTLALLEDGAVLVAGQLRSSGTLPDTSLVRLQSDGRVDPGFRPALRSAQVNALAVQRDGRVLIGGSFAYERDGLPRRNLARLLPDGTLDPSFDPGTGPDALVLCVTGQTDGRILVGGMFKTFAGGAWKGLVRLLPTGEVDGSFQPLPWASATCRSVAVYPDGRIAVLGVFTRADATALAEVARLTADGAWDTTFQPEPWVGLPAMAPEPNGGLLIATPDVGRAVVRLNPDGSRDPSFAVVLTGPAVSQNPPGIRVLLRQPDGRVVVGGKFTKLNGVPRVNLARLEPDGSTDLRFNAKTGPASSLDTLSYMVSVLALQRDGLILVGGPFNTFSGEARSGLVRVTGDPIPRVEVARTAGGSEIRAIGLPGVMVELQTSKDLVTWAPGLGLTNRTGIVEFVVPGREGGFYRTLTRN